MSKKVFFTSDLHLGHRNIIAHCKRPFHDLRHMEECLMRNWNRVVGKKDDIYILGDFIFGSHHRAHDICQQLNGNKFLIKGNHDKNLKGKYVDNFIWIKDLHDLRVEDFGIFKDLSKADKSRNIVLFHYPMITWNKKHYGAWHFHGHTHTRTPRLPGIRDCRIDVGVDAWNYTPVQYERIKEFLEGKEEIQKVDYQEEYWKT